MRAALAVNGRRDLRGVSVAVSVMLLTLIATALGASAILVPFALTVVLAHVVPDNPLAGPRSVLLSYLIAIGAGVLFAEIAPPAIAAGASVGTVVVAAQRLDALHPPAAALALLLSRQPHFEPGIVAVGLGLSATLAGAITLSARVRRGRRPQPRATTGISRAAASA